MNKREARMAALDICIALIEQEMGNPTGLTQDYLSREQWDEDSRKIKQQLCAIRDAFWKRLERYAAD